MPLLSLGLALTPHTRGAFATPFYYNYLVGKGYNFNRIIYILRYYFKTKENK